jgi:YHS domain-containing protein
MNKILTVVLGLVLVNASVVFAQQKPVPESMQSTSSQPVDAGNKFCPVSGRQIGVMGPGVTQEYNGKVYHLCCGGCISTFQSNPEKYSKIADAQVVQNTTNGK